MNVAIPAGEPIDLALWNARGGTQGLVEQALATNPGLAARGVIPAQAYRATLPEITTAAPERRTVKLWG